MNDLICQSLDGYLDDELDAPQREAFQDHVDECELCRAAISQQAKLDRSLRAYAVCIVPNVPAPTRLPAEASPSIASPPIASPSKFKRYAVVFAELCAVALIGCGIWFSLDRMTDDQQVVKETTPQVAAPQEKKPQAKPPPVQEKYWEEEKRRLGAKREELREELRERKAKTDQAKSIADGLQANLAVQDATKDSRSKDAGTQSVAHGNPSAQQKLKSDANASASVDLAKKRSQIYELMRTTKTRVEQIEALARSAKDPSAALTLIKELIGEDAVRAFQKQIPAPDRVTVDVDLNANIDSRLIPLMIERNRYAAEYGPKHPTVKKLDLQLKSMKQELGRLVSDAVLSPDPVRTKQTVNVDKFLKPLMLQRDKLSARFGENHPTIKQLDAELESMKQELKELSGEHGTKLSLSQGKSFKSDLIAVLIKRGELQAKYGANHPEVKSLRGVVEGEKLQIKSRLRRPEDVEASMTYLRKERQKYAVVHGTSDPVCVKIDTELALLKTELEKQSNKIATETVTAIIYAGKGQVQLLKKQVSTLDRQIKALEDARVNPVKDASETGSKAQ